MKNVLESFDAALTQPGHGPRLRAVRSVAQAVREQLLDQPRVQAVRTLPLARIPYPARFAFPGRGLSPAPLVQMTHRCLLIQFRSGGALRTLLFNPSDVVANRATPFFADFIRAVGPLEPLLAPPSPPLRRSWPELGLTAEDIDYVAFDHFHTQDLRPLLGTVDGTFKPRFPRAVLLAPRASGSIGTPCIPCSSPGTSATASATCARSASNSSTDRCTSATACCCCTRPATTSGNQTLLVRTRDGNLGLQRERHLGRQLVAARQPHAGSRPVRPASISSRCSSTPTPPSWGPRNTPR